MTNISKFILNKLFGSTARVSLLKFFLSHQGEKFYIRQIARELDLQLNSVRRELDNLENFGLLKSTGVAPDDEVDGKEKVKKSKSKDVASKTDKKYYMINKDFILLEEIKALFVKAHVLYEKDFSQKILEIGKPKLMLLTGFFVNMEDAVTDILLVGKFDKENLVTMIKELEKEVGRELNYTIMETKEFLYRRDITDMFLYGILENKKIVVVDEFSIV